MKAIKFLTPLFLLFFLSCDQAGPIGKGINSESDFFEAMESNKQWPSYRGFYANGYMHDTNLPDSFNIETSHNVWWNIEIPGLGLSCPVIWDDQVFITTAISDADNEGLKIGIYGTIEPVADSSEHMWKLYCIDKKTGKIEWEQMMHEGIPKVKRHPKSTHANTSVATDGNHIVVFLGSEGLYCYNMKGKLLWKRDFGLIISAWNKVPSAEYEFSSSPLIFQDKVIVKAEGINQAFVAVLDVETGENIWKKERDELSSWCTPNIYFKDENPMVVLNGYKHRGAYDIENGDEVWKISGGGDVPIPTPIVWKDLIFFNSAHGRHAPLMAVKNSVEGEILYPESDSTYSDDYAWFYDRAGAYMTSVVIYEDFLYRLRWNGDLACFDARTGKEIYSEMVHPYSFIASPVISDGIIYLVAEEGMVYIVKAGSAYELLYKIPLGEASLVTPGLVEDVIIFRTASRLIAVGY